MGFSTALLNVAIQIIDQVGYYGIGIVLMLDNAGVPIPSEGILGLAGVASGVGKYNIVLLFFIALLMETVGSTLSFWIGWHGGGPFIKRYGKYVFISAHDYDKAQKWFKKRGAKAIFVSRLTPVVRTFMGFVAGAARMDYASFLVQSIFGTAIWTVLWLGIGYFLGDSWNKYYGYAKYLDYIVIVALIALAIRFIWKRTHKSA